MTISARTTMVVLCVTAIIVCAAGVYALRQQNDIRQEEKAQTRVVPSDPVELSIPKLKFEKKVMLGFYDINAQKWNLSTRYPYFATVSSKPGTEDGNTVIYAHNSRDLFGPISLIKADDTVTVTTKDGKHYVYQYEFTKDVKPLDVSVFSVNRGSHLTLITCTGKDNSLRKLVFFRLINVI